MCPKEATVRTRFARRDFMGAGAALIGVAAAGPLLAQQPPAPVVERVKGPPVWLDMDQVRRAVAWVHRNAQSFGGDPNRIYVSGHSSGAHLAGVVLTTDWRKEFNLPADTVKGGLCCSGLFDLKAVRLSARSAYVKFTDEIEQALSSQRHLDNLNAPVIVAHGTLETPEFQRQSRDFAAAVKAAGKPVQLVVGEGYNHFEIVETLANPYGLLGRAVLEQMKLVQA